MSEKAIIAKDLSVILGGNQILSKNSFELEQNQIVGIVGPNGAGKTTLLKVILGLITPYEGSIEVFGMKAIKARRLMGYLPQLNQFNREFPITVLDVVMLGRLHHRSIFSRFKKEDKEIVKQALDTVGMLSFKDKNIGKISGGELQRVLIARALTANPKLLLLDEPTSNVDPGVKGDLYKLLHKLKKDMTILLVTHDIGVISSYVDKVICLNRELIYKDSNDITRDDLETMYKRPVNLILHDDCKAHYTDNKN